MGRLVRRRRARAAPVVVPEKIERMCNARARKMREEFGRLDALPLLERRLLAYFGSERAGNAMSKVNPPDVARYLRDEDGFARYCGEADAAAPAAAPKPNPAAVWVAFNGG